VRLPGRGMRASLRPYTASFSKRSGASMPSMWRPHLSRSSMHCAA
jgi:hypothetical protein